jgi:four helix bundle protein
MVKGYKDLVVWQKSSDLVLEIYKVLAEFPVDERYGITSQIKRSAISIPSNIAEGSIRRSKKEFIRFINISSGSAAELQTQLYLSMNLGFLDRLKFEELDKNITSILKMLFGLQKSLSDVTYLNEEEAEDFIIELTKY